MTIKASVICASEATLAGLGVPESARPGVVLTALPGAVAALADVLRRDQPDLVVLEMPTGDEQDMLRIEAALAQAPGTYLVLVSSDRSVGFLTRAMRAGVREVLAAPLNGALIEDVIKHARQRHAVAGRRRDQAGQVLAMVPTKGGNGTTFLATNLAFALARQGRRVALLDFNFYWGDAALYLCDQDPVFSVVDVIQQTQRMDPALLDSSMLKVNPYLHVLAAPELPVHVNQVSEAGVERLMEIARGNYDFVVLDASSAFDPATVKALELADAVFLTLQQELPCVRAARRMAGAFRELGLSSNKLSVIINRYEKHRAITLEDVKKATLLKIGRTIPNSHAAVSASVDQGIALLEMSPRDPVARTLHDWAEELAPAPHQPATGWWHNLLRPR